MTKSKCDQLKDSRYRVNPHTGHSIKPTGRTAIKLRKECGLPLPRKRKAIVKGANYRLTKKQLNKGKSYKARSKKRTADSKLTAWQKFVRYHHAEYDGDFSAMSVAYHKSKQ